MNFEIGSLLRLSVENPNVPLLQKGLIVLVVKAIELDDKEHFIPKWECYLPEREQKAQLYDFQLKDAEVLCR